MLTISFPLFQFVFLPFPYINRFSFTVHPIFYCTYYVLLYMIHPIFYCTFYILLYIRYFTVHPIFYCTSYVLLYILCFTVHPIVYCTSYILLYIRYFTVHPIFYCTSNILLYILYTFPILLLRFPALFYMTLFFLCCTLSFRTYNVTLSHLTLPCSTMSSSNPLHH